MLAMDVLTKRNSRWPVYLACITAAIIGLLLIGRASVPEGDVSDPSRYAVVLADLGYPTPTKLNTPTLAHFPATVPDGATNVRFFYRPHFLQGAALLQIRCVLPPDAIGGLTTRFAAAAKEVQAGGGTFTAINAGTGKLASTLFRDATNTDFADLPDDFQVFILDAQTTSAWNHIGSYGVAVSGRRGEVIYWVQDG
jgi:hypothetical protein